MLGTYLDNNLEYPPDWYLAKTKPLSEKLALTTIESIGYSAFLPIVRMVTTTHEEKDVCIFPGYIFVKSGNVDSLLPDIRPIGFLSGWVKFDGVVSSVSDDVICDLKLYLDELNQDGGLWARFQKEEIVEVFISGFAVKAKIIEEPLSPYSNALVLMKFMGRDIKASVNWKYINSKQVAVINHKIPRRTRGKGRIIKNNPSNYSFVH